MSTERTVNWPVVGLGAALIVTGALLIRAYVQDRDARTVTTTRSTKGDTNVSVVAKPAPAPAAAPASAPAHAVSGGGAAMPPAVRGVLQRKPSASGMSCCSTTPFCGVGHVCSHAEVNDVAARAKSMFDITTANGFLPLIRPLRSLPDTFRELEEVMRTLPELLHDSDPEKLKSAVAALPQYSIPLDASPQLMQSLMRDFSVLVSAYLLEGKTKSGTPRTTVPANIAVPFTTVAKRLDEEWIMSYDSYCLSNCYSTKESEEEVRSMGMSYEPECGKWDWENLRLVRAFDGGAEEYTFIAIHFEMESHTARLVASIKDIGNGLREKDILTVKDGLRQLKEVMDCIIVSQLKMFNASDPRNYEKFVRPWIFGWRGNPDFESGVTFEGVDAPPTFLRGETGAQSTIIPAMDVVLGITHRADELRKMLQELEAYRPKPQRDFLAELRVSMWGADTGAGAGATGDVSETHALRKFLAARRDKEAVRLFNACVGNVWAFRDIHVTFASLYIGRYTNKEYATGGTPYKAYLRKHRDESIAQQMLDLGEDCLTKFSIPSEAQMAADLDTVLKDSTVNGIPPHLLSRHADIIRTYGRGVGSLSHKAFPTGAEWQRK